MFLLYKLGEGSAGKGSYQSWSIKNLKEGSEQKVSLLIKGNRALNTGNNTEVVSKIICDYHFNEEKGMQE